MCKTDVASHVQLLSAKEPARTEQRRLLYRLLTSCCRPQGKQHHRKGANRQHLIWELGRGGLSAETNERERSAKSTWLHRSLGGPEAT